MLDILKILKRYQIPYDTSVNPGWVNVSCPFCHPGDTGFHGGFNLSGEYFHCWRCGGFSIEWALKRLLRLEHQAYLQLIEEFSTDIQLRVRLNRKKAQAKSLTLPGEELNPGERKYLKKRGFDPDFLTTKYGVQGGGIAGKWKYRIIIPIFLNQQAVSFTARDITGESDMRYKTLSIEESVVDPKTIFYNSDNCRGSMVGILEGPTDVWRMGDGFMCSFGTSMEEAQIRFIAQNFKEAFFMFDPEPEAQRKARKYAESLSVIGGVSVSIVDMEYACDPGDLTELQALKLRRELGM